MSDEANKVEAEAETDPEALFKQFEADELGSEQGKEPEGQATDRTPEGQADTGTPSEDAGKTPPASDEQPDIWKDAPPALRDAYEAERQRAAQAENVAKAHGGRLAQAYQERDALAEKLAEAGKAAGASTEQEGGESDEDYRRRMTEDYPEFARLFETLDAATAKIDSLEGSVDTANASVRTAQTEAALETQGKIFEEAHPQWEAEKKDPAVQERFMEWAEGQPPYVQDALRANAKTITDGSTAADLISRFKRETESPAQRERDERRREQLDGARDARVSAPGASKSGASDDDTEGLWNEFGAKERRQEQRTRR